MDRLLNEKEASKYLGISEDELRELVHQKRMPAYKIAGQFLRFDPKDLDAVKEKHYSLFSRLKDYIYYNDFYIIVAILILVLLALVFKASF